MRDRPEQQGRQQGEREEAEDRPRPADRSASGRSDAGLTSVGLTVAPWRSPQASTARVVIAPATSAEAYSCGRKVTRLPRSGPGIQEI
ncbi:hypothetical protein ACFU51_11190 [Streptomyces sp. NPDC057430]|uniref:hypothetical protein n=1 Tax=unclassified Streptomyces TaxID=2593676 RepID=UPI0036CBCE37